MELKSSYYLSLVILLFLFWEFLDLLGTLDTGSCSKLPLTSFFLVYYFLDLFIWLFGGAFFIYSLAFFAISLKAAGESEFLIRDWKA